MCLPHNQEDKHMNNGTALLALARSLTKGKDITISIGGNDARTDGRHIVLPYITEAPRNAMKAIWGFLYHEVAHILWSSFDVVYMDRRKEIQNCIEDTFIERKMVQERPAARNAIGDTHRYVIDRGEFPPIWDIPDADGYLQGCILYTREPDDGFPELEPLMEDAKEVGRVWFTDRFLSTFFADVIDKLGLVESSEDTNRLTNKVFDLLESELKELISSGDEESPYADNIRDILSNKSGISLAGNLHDSMREVMQHYGEENGGGPVTEAPVEGWPQPKANFGILGHALRSARPLGQSLREIEMNQDTSVSAAAVKGYLNPRRLASAVAGNNNVYVRKVGVSAPVSTGIVLLLDNSYSMSGQPLETAKQAIASIASGMEQLHHTRYSVVRYPVSGNLKGIAYNNACQVLTAFNENIEGTWSRYGFKEEGSTPTTEALMFARGMLSEGRFDRRVIILVTDGGADNGESCIREVAECAESGIEIIGIGIDVPNISSLIPNSVCIKDVTELQSVLSNAVESLIATTH